MKTASCPHADFQYHQKYDHKMFSYYSPKVIPTKPPTEWSFPRKHDGYLQKVISKWFPLRLDNGLPEVDCLNPLALLHHLRSHLMVLLSRFRISCLLAFCLLARIVLIRKFREHVVRILRLTLLIHLLDILITFDLLLKFLKEFPKVFYNFFRVFIIFLHIQDIKI